MTDDAVSYARTGTFYYGLSPSVSSFSGILLNPNVKNTMIAKKNMSLSKHHVSQARAF
jgi:hypothetical protein